MNAFGSGERHPARGGGVVLYAGHKDGEHEWRYAVLGTGHERLTELDARPATALRFTERSAGSRDAIPAGVRRAAREGVRE